jgi:hypothetical protein
MNNPLQVKKLLGGSQYSRLVSQARALLGLDGLVQELLPDALKTHCRVLSVRDETLVLAADSPVWAARLKFHSSQLVKQLNRQQTVKLRTVRIRVRPPEKQLVTERRNTPLKLGINSATALRQAADSVSDPDLKSALLRLANRQFSR